MPKGTLIQRLKRHLLPSRSDARGIREEVPHNPSPHPDAVSSAQLQSARNLEDMQSDLVQASNIVIDSDAADRRSKGSIDRSTETSRKSTARDALTVGYFATRNLLTVIERASEVFPPLKGVIGCVNALLEANDAFTSNQEEFNKLSERVKMLDQILRGRSEEDLPQEIKDRREGLTRSIDNLGNELEEKTCRNGFTRAAYSGQDRQDILRIVREMTFAIELTMLDVTIHNETMVFKAVAGIDWLKEETIEEFSKIAIDVSDISKGVESLNKAELFRKLGDVKGFAFTRGGRRKGCVAGSRITLLSQLMAWAEGRGTRHVFWLSGVAGAGKTAVSESFCLELSKRGMLGASFFCSVTDQDLSDVYHIVPSLAKTLAKARPRFGNALAEILDQLSGDVDPLEMKLEEQYDYLIARPAAESFDERDRPVVLCVDALDECRGIRALQEFLDAVVPTATASPVKIFLTSRPEPTIRERMDSPEYSPHRQALRLQDLGHEMVQQDIQIYVRQALGDVTALRRHYGHDWPPPEVQKIAERSGTLFIVAATYVRYIDNESGNRIERLQSCANDESQEQQGVEPLYFGILKRASAALTLQEQMDMKSCLSLLVAAQRPLTLGEYGVLLHRPKWAIMEAFRPLYSVVDISETDPVTVFHASFVNFLTTYRRSLSIDMLWDIDIRRAHSMLVDLSLELMASDDSSRKGVYFGVSEAVTSRQNNDNQPRELKLGAGLSYACAEWGTHALYALPLSDDMEDRIQTFLEEKAVFWIEALGVDKKVGTRSTNVLFELSKASRSHRLKDLLGNVREFAAMFATPINYSTPHLYLSALPFFHLAMPSATWRPPQIHSGPAVNIVPDANDEGHSRGGKVLAASLMMSCMALSPDGSTLVVGTEHGRVELWDALSGERLLVLGKDPDQAFHAVAFSPDGSRIASGWGKSIRLWDAHTGDIVAGFAVEGHSDLVRSVAFSPDGEHIVSASDDKTLQVWDALSGILTLGPLEGHASAISTVVFSPDGSKLVSASRDGAIKVWSLRAGETPAISLEGHDGAVECVAFSPSGKTLASSSRDRTVRIWDVQSGKLAMHPLEGHTNRVGPVCFSPDGSSIASGSYDGEIRIWDAQTGQLEESLLQAHRADICGLAFSPDGSKLYSGSLDDMIRVCETRSISHHEEAAAVDLKGSAEYVNGVAFFPDGSKIVSGASWWSPLKSLRVWDTQSGQLVPNRFEPRGPTFHLALSPDGSKLASGSHGDVIQMWDACTGQHIRNFPEGYNYDEETGGPGFIVRAIAFSPDGSQVAFKSHPNTVSVWDVRSGSPVSGMIVLGTSPSEAKELFILSFPLAFSPDGSKLVTASGDEPSVLVLDSQNGRPVLDPMEGHTGYITAVAFSPDGSSIISGSTDKTIRMWDGSSGRLMMTPLRGHNQSISSLAFSPDGSTIISASCDRTIRLWDAESGRKIMGPLIGHTDRVRSVAFRHDGLQFASGSWDGTIRVWNLARTQANSSPTFLHHYPHSSFSMEEDGWIRNTGGDLLFWVPPQFRPWIRIQPLDRVIAGPMIEIDLTYARCHGYSWLKCKDPRPEGVDATNATYGEPWPVDSPDC